MTPLSAPYIKGNEWKYIKDCLDTGWVSCVGMYVDLFEQKICEYTGSKYGVACVNGTAALQVSLRLSGVLPGDEVIVPTITFIASVNAVRYNGAEPVFMDADDYYNIDAEKAIEFLQAETVFEDGYTYNRKTGRRISAIILVHVFGNAVWMDELVDLCKERNIVVVEDAAESLGTRYTDGKFSGRHTGTIGRLGCLSFNGNKIITAGGGGMILTNYSELAEKARYLTTQAKDDAIHFVHNEIGYNFRLSNVQAAIGVAQLEQLSEFLERKKTICRLYTNEIKEIKGLNIAPVPDYSDNNHWMNILQINQKVYRRGKKILMVDLKNAGIQTRSVWYPNHLQKPYRNCQTYSIERAEKLVETSLCLPGSVNMTQEQFNEVIKFL